MNSNLFTLNLEYLCPCARFARENTFCNGLSQLLHLCSSLSFVFPVTPGNERVVCKRPREEAIFALFLVRRRKF